jgi:hypothetical protein
MFNIRDQVEAHHQLISNFRVRARGSCRAAATPESRYSLVLLLAGNSCSASKDSPGGCGTCAGDVCEALSSLPCRMNSHELLDEHTRDPSLATAGCVPVC